jgi:hypothetical protein
MSDKGIDFNFEAISSSDFELSLKMNTKNKLIRFIFDKAQKQLGFPTAKRFDDCTEFSIPKQYFKFIKTYTNKSIRDVKRQVSEDNIRIINYEVVSASFKRVSNEDWNIDINYRGLYKDGRIYH